LSGFGEGLTEWDVVLTLGEWGTFNFCNRLVVVRVSDAAISSGAVTTFRGRPRLAAGLGAGDSGCTILSVSVAMAVSHNHIFGHPSKKLRKIYKKF
jgi:hypothetical protein